MSLAERLTEYVSAAFSGLWVESHEHDDAIREIARSAARRIGGWRRGTSNRGSRSPARKRQRRRRG